MASPPKALDENLRRQGRGGRQRVEDNAFRPGIRTDSGCVPVFYDPAALGDQQIAGFLAKQRDCSRSC